MCQGFLPLLKKGCGVAEPLMAVPAARYGDRSLSCGKEVVVLEVAIMIEGQDGINWARWRRLP